MPLYLVMLHKYVDINIYSQQIYILKKELRGNVELRCEELKLKNIVIRNRCSNLNICSVNVKLTELGESTKSW